MPSDDMTGRVDVAAAKLIDLLVAGSGNETLQMLHETFKPVVRAQVMQSLGPGTQIGKRARTFAKKLDAFNRLCDPVKTYNEVKRSPRREDVVRTTAKVEPITAEFVEPEVIEVKPNGD